MHLCGLCGLSGFAGFAREQGWPADVGLADPDPAVRLATWRQIAREHIPIELCMDLADRGFPELARELMRQRGDVE
jgi:hypothetical protein